MTVKLLPDTPQGCQLVLLVVRVVFLFLALQQKVESLLLMAIHFCRHRRCWLHLWKISCTPKALEDSVDLVLDLLCRANARSTVTRIARVACVSQSSSGVVIR